MATKYHVNTFLTEVLPSSKSSRFFGKFQSILHMTGYTTNIQIHITHIYIPVLMFPKRQQFQQNLQYK
jgi:hypothetical protein